MTSLRAGVVVIGADDFRRDDVCRDVALRASVGTVASVERARELSPCEARRIVVPGFVNAHAHLDLGALAGVVDARQGFLPWINALVAARAEATEEELALGARASADELLANGATSVIDIDATGSAPAALAHHPLRTLSMREVIDGSPAVPDGRTRASIEAAQVVAQRRSRSDDDRRAWGISPHAPHTVGDALLRSIGELRASDPSLPLTVHWAETREEVEWLADGGGPFAGWLGPSPQVSGVERLARAGVLARTLLVHGNEPGPGDPDVLARSGAAIVHCPGCHAFFGRARFPYERYTGADVPVALGTDSSASNAVLDMRREMRLAVEHLGIAPRAALAMATSVPARWLPWPRVTGTLSPGSALDAVVLVPPDGVDVRSLTDEEIFACAIDAQTRVAAVLVDGAVVRGTVA